MKQIIEEKEMPYNLWCSDKLKLPKAKTTCLEIDRVRIMEKGMGDTTTIAEKLGFPSGFQYGYQNP